jgi:uncharacterized protein (TIGR02117 family)
MLTWGWGVRGAAGNTKMSSVRPRPCVAFCLLASALTGCLGPVAGVFPPKPGEPTETVFIVNHWWHTGIVVETQALPESARPSWPAAAQSRYLEIGWGDDGFYRAEKPTLGIALRSVFWRNPAVLHVVALDREPIDYFPEGGIVRVAVSTNGFNRLCRYLSASYATQGPGWSPIDLGQGIYGDSRFYRATGHYYFPNTCNVWTARALRSTGAPITPCYAARAENVFNQASEFGTVERGLEDD